jgi:hypothetical protein
VTHWIWAVALFFMVTSGLQVFNAHPILYFGWQSGFGDKQYLGPQAGYGNRQFNNTVLDIHAERRGDTIVGVTSDALNVVARLGEWNGRPVPMPRQAS